MVQGRIRGGTSTFREFSKRLNERRQPTADAVRDVTPLTDFVRPCTIRFMKLSISEARKRLPELVRQVSKDAGAKIEITVHDEVVAELRAALPEPEPGAAAKKLVALMRRLPKHRGRKTNLSGHINEYLYGSSAKGR